jgi:two-component system phosphate regulon sensor histidine kinase PhoR
MTPDQAPSPTDLRGLFTRFVLLVLLPVVGLVGFGVMAIANERAAVEKRFQEQYAGRLHALAAHLAETVDAQAADLGSSREEQTPQIRLRFTLSGGQLTASEPLPQELHEALVASLVANAPPLGTVVVFPVAAGPARGLYAVRRDADGLRGAAFQESALAQAVATEGARLFPTDLARFTLVGPRDRLPLSTNPMRRLLEEVTSDRAEANPLSLPLPPPLSEWRITAQLPAADPIRTALWRNRVIYIAVLSLFYVVIAIGVAMTLRTITREMRLSRMKTDFVSNISHELRTPLTSIRMYAETLKLGRARTHEERETCIDAIFQESERLSAIAERTLDWARIEAGRRVFEEAPVDLCVLVRETVELFLARGTVARDRLSSTIDPGPLLIQGDRSALSQVVMNLLENAAKYTPHEKRIELRLKRDGRSVLVEVEDNGIGMSRADMRRIFERFYRADDLLARRTEGTGLGLSISRKIIDAHRGRITVRSRLGAGSTFTISLPSLASAPQSHA